MDIICIALGMIFFISGIAFALGKIHTHMDVWKAMPPEEKENIRILPLCRNIGEMIMLSGVIFLLKGLCRGFSGRWFTLTMIVWFIAAGFDVWHISKSGRYQNKK